VQKRTTVLLAAMLMIGTPAAPARVLAHDRFPGFVYTSSETIREAQSILLALRYLEPDRYKAGEWDKVTQKATWESGDFGQIARTIEHVAEQFMARQPLQTGSRVLDVACGTGNLALLPARRGCVVSGVDIASNLIAQARARAAAEGLRINFKEGDAEALPFVGCQFDLVVSM